MQLLQRWDHALAREASVLSACDRMWETTPEPEYDRLGIPSKGYNKATGKATDSPLHYVRRWFDERRYFDSKYHVCNFGRECNNYMQVSFGHFTEDINFHVVVDTEFCTVGVQTIFTYSVLFTMG